MSKYVAVVGTIVVIILVIIVLFVIDLLVEKWYLQEYNTSNKKVRVKKNVSTK